jgi:hypothetical protein
MTFKSPENGNFARVGVPGGAGGDPALTAQAKAPLCDEFGRLIVVIDGTVPTSGGGTSTPIIGTGAGVAPADPPRSPTPQAGEFVIADGSSVIVMPDDSVPGDRVGIYAENDTDVTAPIGESIVFGTQTFPGGTTFVMPAGTYGEWVLAADGTTRVWYPGGASSNATVDFPPYSAFHEQPITIGKWAIYGSSGNFFFPPPTAAGQRIGFFNPEPSTFTLQDGTNLYFGNTFYSGVGTIVEVGQNVYAEWYAFNFAEGGLTWVPRGFSNEAAPSSGGGAQIGLPYNGTFETLSIDTFGLLTAGGPVTFPLATAPNQRVGVVALAPVDIVPVDPQNIYWIDGGHSSAAPISLRPNTYAEWVSVDIGGDLYWFPAGAANEAGLLTIRGIQDVPEFGSIIYASTSQLITLPIGTTPNQRVGIFFGTGVNPVGRISPAAGQAIQWVGADNIIDDANWVSVPQGSYTEWIFNAAFNAWFAVGSSNEGAAGAGWLSFSSGNQPELGEWIFASASPVSLPAISAGGHHVGFYITVSNGPLELTASDSFNFGRGLYNGGSTIPLHSGGWYEFVSRDEGEGFRWYSLATGDTSKAPLESAEHAVQRPAFPNMWSLASRDTAVPLPYNPLDGDSYGIYADVGCTVFCFEPGANIEAPDLSTVVSPPDTINLIAGTYYEWIYTAGDNTWHPRQNMLMTGGGGGGGGGDSLPIIPGNEGTPTLDTWALYDGVALGNLVLPEGVPFGSRIGVFTLTPTNVTAASLGREFTYNGVKYDAPATAAIPAFTYTEWSYQQSPFNDTTTWFQRGSSSAIVSGGGGGGGDSLPIIPAIYGVPTLNTWAIVEGGTVVFPTGPAQGDRIGFFTYDEPCNLTGPANADFVYAGRWYVDPDVVVIPSNVYVEWSYIDSSWIPRGDSGTGDLVFTDYDLSAGTWVLAAEATTTFIPTAITQGQRIGIYVKENDRDVEFQCAGTPVMIDRTLWAAGAHITCHHGSWYEWVSLYVFGELRWIPVGGSGSSNKPILENYTPGQTYAPMNMWLMGSQFPNFELPIQVEHGDCIGIYADVATQVRPAQSTFLERPNLTGTVAWPTYLTLTAGSYYEWFYNHNNNTWHPRQNGKMQATTAEVTTLQTQVAELQATVATLQAQIAALTP